MNKYDAREIAALFDRGENVIEWIKSLEGTERNSVTAILYSYDVQSGSYTRQLEEPDVRELKNKIGRHLAAVLDELAPECLLDAGIGEATSLVPILRHMKKTPGQLLGFDLSLSRLLFARRHLSNNGSDKAVLFTGALDRIPLASSSVDVVLTIHALEPNGGYEEAILSELLRVASRHVVLIEPSYETGSAETRARMHRLGYVRGVSAALKHLGAPHRHLPFPYNANPLNEAALIVVDKPGTAAPTSAPSFVSPISGRKLLARQDCWYCPEDGHAFPVIAGIPCLVAENSVLVSKLQQFD